MGGDLRQGQMPRRSVPVVVGAVVGSSAGGDFVDGAVIPGAEGGSPALDDGNVLVERAPEGVPAGVPPGEGRDDGAPDEASFGEGTLGSEAAPDEGSFAGGGAAGRSTPVGEAATTG